MQMKIKSTKCKNIRNTTMYQETLSKILQKTSKIIKKHCNEEIQLPRTLRNKKLTLSRRTTNKKDLPQIKKNTFLFRILGVCQKQGA